MYTNATRGFGMGVRVCAPDGDALGDADAEAGAEGDGDAAADPDGDSGAAFLLLLPHADNTADNARTRITLIDDDLFNLFIRFLPDSLSNCRLSLRVRFFLFFSAIWPATYLKYTSMPN